MKIRSKFAMVAATAGLAAILGGVVAPTVASAAPRQPADFCAYHNYNTNIFDKPTGIGIVHIYFGLFACLGNGGVTQWSPTYGTAKYGSLQQFTQVSTSGTVRNCSGCVMGTGHVYMVFGFKGVGFPTVGTDFRCQIGHPSGYIGPVFNACYATKGDEETFSGPFAVV